MQIITQFEKKYAQPSAIALGSFDGLHIGHRAVINSAVEYAKQSDDTLIPGIFMMSGNIRKADIIMPFSIKCSILPHLGIKRIYMPKFGDMHNLSPEQFVYEILYKKLNAKYISCGYNYHFGKNAAGDCNTLRDLCNNYGIICDIIKPVTYLDDTVSSTRIRKCLELGNIRLANEMLHTPFTINFEVVSGRKIGRLLGTPTLNQIPPKGFVLPKFGVYASFANVGGKFLPSVTNFGIKPTVGAESWPLYETWIMDYNGSLYGKHIEVSLLEFLRAEQKFDNTDLLRERIFLDGDKSKDIFKNAKII